MFCVLVITLAIYSVFTFLSGQGVTCHSYDARWHGQSELDDRMRIKIDSFDTLATDLEEMCNQKRAGAVELPSDAPLLLQHNEVTIACLAAAWETFPGTFIVLLLAGFCAERVSVQFAVMGWTYFK